MHYQRTLRNPKVPRTAPADERFDEKWRLDPETGCHIWWGGKAVGYGVFWDGERYVKAHRYAYIRKYGPIPDGLHMDHFVCDTRACCNPDHVRPVTPRENSLRGNNGVTAMNAAKTHCKRGHPFDAMNTRIRASDGGRICRACQEYQRRRRAAS